MNRQNLFAAFFFATLFFLLFQLYRILAPFSTPLILASVLVVTLAPITNRLRLALRGYRAQTAAVTSIGTATLVLVPMALLLTLLAEQAAEIYGRVHDGSTT